MSEPASTLPPIAALSGLSAGAIWAGLDQAAVIAAFGGALLFTFVAKDTQVLKRIGSLVGAWILGYFFAAEIVKRQLLGFTTTPVPAFVCAFFGVVFFKTLLVIFDDSGEGWLRKKLGLTKEGNKVE